MKYVMLSINGKEVDGDIYVRRVLLEYKNKDFEVSKGGTPVCFYKGTRFVEKDNYFRDVSKNNQYEFHDDHYTLTKTNYAHNRFLEGEQRQYHSFAFDTDDPYYKALGPIEFEADSDEEAIKKFVERDELR